MTQADRDRLVALKKARKKLITRRKVRALLIVSDEFRPAIPRSGWSPPEPVSASPAHAE